MNASAYALVRATAAYVPLHRLVYLGVGRVRVLVQQGRGLHYLRMVSQLPRTFNRLMAEETLEIMAFMDAAERSRQQGGVPVRLAQ